MRRAGSSIVFRVCRIGEPERLPWRPALCGENFVAEAVGGAGPIVVVRILWDFRAAVGMLVTELQKRLIRRNYLRFGGCEAHCG
jgi:hypothetical protein